ncbi:SDR family NAD(P)-dependent oxidoreductase [Alteribacillus sp. HJP-4]|uniref:SDR family NAD(P)-dependent oxidoreductase n=1 Tax=Alteribacillus sp. HJP-4 TaxID=2775394 RepID=UPI0035CCFF51
MNYLITGGNRGLGLCLVDIVLKAGHRVFVSIRNVEEKNQELVNLQENYPETLNILHIDVKDEELVKKASAKLAGLHIKLDCIINNAGAIKGRESSITDLIIEDLETIVNVNTFGPMRVVKYFLPLLNKDSGQSSIINISSDAASLSKPFDRDYPYGISKSALNMFTIKLRKELQNEGISVLAVHPGWMRTDMGGSEAAMDPQEAASSIYKLIEKGIVHDIAHILVNHRGEHMDL